LDSDLSKDEHMEGEGKNRENGAKTLSLTTLGQTTFSIMTLSMTIKNATLTITMKCDFQHSKVMRLSITFWFHLCWCRYAGYRYAECVGARENSNWIFSFRSSSIFSFFFWPKKSDQFFSKTFMKETKERNGWSKSEMLEPTEYV